MINHEIHEGEKKVEELKCLIVDLLRGVGTFSRIAFVCELMVLHNPY